MDFTLDKPNANEKQKKKKFQGNLFTSSQEASQITYLGYCFGEEHVTIPLLSLPGTCFNI